MDTVGLQSHEKKVLDSLFAKHGEELIIDVQLCQHAVSQQLPAGREPHSQTAIFSVI